MTLCAKPTNNYDTFNINDAPPLEQDDTNNDEQQGCTAKIESSSSSTTFFVRNKLVLATSLFAVSVVGVIGLTTTYYSATYPEVAPTLHTTRTDADVDADVGKGKGVDVATTPVIITNNLLRSNTKISCGFLDWGCRCTGKESCSEGKENRGASCDQDNCCPFSDDTDCCRERFIWL